MRLKAGAVLTAKRLLPGVASFPKYKASRARRKLRKCYSGFLFHLALAAFGGLNCFYIIGFFSKASNPHAKFTYLILVNVNKFGMQVYTSCSFIYPKDVRLFTRKSIRHARLLVQKIKVDLGKQKGQCITVLEFCDYMSLKVEDVMSMLRS